MDVSLIALAVSDAAVISLLNCKTQSQWNVEDFKFEDSVLDIVLASYCRVLILTLIFFCCHEEAKKSVRFLSIVAFLTLFFSTYGVVKLSAAPELHRDHWAVAVCFLSIGFPMVESLMVIVNLATRNSAKYDGVVNLNEYEAISTNDESESASNYHRLDNGSNNVGRYALSQFTDENKRDKRMGQGTSFMRLISLAWPERYILSAATFCLFLASATQMIVPTVFGQIIQTITKTDNENARKDLDHAVLMLVILFVSSSLFASIRGSLFNLSGERVVARFRIRLFDSVIRQDIEFFDANQSGELQSRLSNDTTVIQNAVTTNVSMGLRWLAQVVVGIAILFALSWKLTLIMLSVVPVIAIGARQYGMFVRDLAKNYQKALAEAGESAEQSFSCIRTVRSFSKEDYRTEEYVSRINESYKYGKYRAIAYGVFLGVVGLAAYLAIALVLWYGGRLVVSGNGGDMNSAKLTSFLLYTIYIAVALGGLSGLYSSLMSAVGASERMFELIDRVPKIPTAHMKDSSDGSYLNSETSGKIEFRNVNFSYPTRKDVQVLKDLSFICKPGETTAIVGPSGGGKSTIVSMILRFYDPNSGCVFFDDVLLTKVDPLWLHSHVACVSQEPTLFASSIAENITFGTHRIVTEAEIQEAAKQANAHEFISAFPEGYNTKVGERGVQLSGGQKQRIAIARAIIAKPSVLLLDEATSSLDSNSEHLVQEALDRIMGSRVTSIVIAHRLSTVVNSHNIIVLKGGQIIQQGKHDDLLKDTNGLYKELVEKQSNF